MAGGHRAEREWHGGGRPAAASLAAGPLRLRWPAGCGLAAAAAWLLGRGRRSRSLARLLAALGAAAWARSAALWCLGLAARRRRRFLCVASPLPGSAVKLARPLGPAAGAARRWPWSALPERWRGFCPSCKRPVELFQCEEWHPATALQDARGRYAYVICLWGSSVEFLIGAMVLGRSLVRSGSKHSLVCLCADDVPPGFVPVLSHFWDCRPVAHVQACMRTLSFSEEADRFEKVFTKLRCLELVEFEKVLMMDIDLLVRSNIDELFELRPPAAMRRGNNTFNLKTGDQIDGRPFFLGSDGTKWSWGQGTGINAGVMLLQPDLAVFEEMLREIQEPNHPEHCKGNGPEQDFLSRFYADAPWTHIGVEYNFQLHQMYYALHPDRAPRAERVRLAVERERVKVVHFSGEPAAKPWHRVLDSRWAGYWPERARDGEYAELFAEEFLGHLLWVKKDRAAFESSGRGQNSWDVYGMSLDSRGRIWRRAWGEEDKPAEIVGTPAFAAEGVAQFTATVLREWFDDLQALEAELGCDLRQRLEDICAVRRYGVPLASRQGAAPGQSDAAAGNGHVLHQARGLERGTIEIEGGEAIGQLASAGAPSAAEAVAHLTLERAWRRHGGPGGWWTDSAGLAGDDAVKVSVVCGAPGGARFVTFTEGGAATFTEEDPDLAGVFAKVVGQHAPRQFSVHEDPDSALASMHMWVSGVPAGSAVLLALLRLPPEAVAAALAVLAPLGLLRAPPPEACVALAAVGLRPEGGGEGAEQQDGRPAGRPPRRGAEEFSVHASEDVAYASAQLLHVA